METHPVTLAIGFVCTLLLAALVATGLGCTAYKFDPESYQSIKPYYTYAKEKKVC